MDEFRIDTSGGEAPPPMVVRSRDFEALAIIMKFMGGLITLIGLLCLLPADTRILGALVSTMGLLFIVFAIGFTSFKRWAWAGTVVLL